MVNDPETLHKGGFNTYTQDPAGIPSASSLFLRYAISLDFLSIKLWLKNRELAETVL